MIKIKGNKYKGEITPPSSKSDAHRALICACLCKNPSLIKNISFSNDINATISSLTSLGAKFIIKGNEVLVNPILNRQNEVHLDINESGSTLRFLIPLSLVYSKYAHFHLKGNLINRPIDSFIEAFKNQDIKITKEDDGYLVQGELNPGEFIIDGNVSSQFISGLLFTLPLLNGDSSILIKNKISSLNYILMTIDTLSKFGIKIDFKVDKNLILIKGNQIFKETTYIVENDFSQASFFLALGLINDTITVKNMNLSSYQADKNIINILKKMNANIEIKDNSIIASPSKLVGTTISLDENPDLGPILFSLAPLCETPTKFINIERLRIKESNRVDAMLDNLKKLGVTYKEIDSNSLVIFPSKLISPKEELCSYNDHRIFMSLCIISSLLNELTLDNETCINKSYPKFLDDLNSLKVGD